jgi:hypothetical protein
MKNLRHFTVTADRATGEWLGVPHFTGRYVDAEKWVRGCTWSKYYDTFERPLPSDTTLDRDGVGTETCAITVVWQD